MKFFRNFDAETLKRIMAHADTAVYDSGDNIYKIGHIGFLQSGTANVIRTGTGGKSITVRNITSGDIFGAASLFGVWNENLSKITAQGKCVVKYFSESKFTELLRDFPSLAINYIKFLTDRIRFLNRRLDTFSAGSTENRLYEFLLTHQINGEVNSNISMTELAKRLDIGRTSLYRDIENLEKAGLIKRSKNKFIIL